MGPQHGPALGLLLLPAACAVAPHSPSTFVFENPTELILAGGASVQSAPLYSLRSGNPHAHTSAALRVALNPGATVTRATFAYRYNTGFDPSGVGTNFTLAVATQSAYTSPHLTDYTYGHNKSNYSLPVAVDAASLAIVVPATVPSYVEFLFANNDRNVQLLLPLTVTLECSGAIPCTPPPPPPPSHILLFKQPPSIVAGPEVPWVKGSGPWWQNIQALSDTHALGWAEQAIIATTDSGKTWDTPVFNDSAACELRGQQLCEAKTGYAIYPTSSGGANCGGNRCGPFHTLGEQNETAGSKGNITGTAAVASTRYFLDADGNFARELTGKAINISGLPNLRMFGGSGHYLTLADGSMVSCSDPPPHPSHSPSKTLIWTGPCLSLIRHMPYRWALLNRRSRKRRALAVACPRLPCDPQTVDTTGSSPLSLRGRRRYHKRRRARPRVHLRRSTTGP
eukprot:COSAG02_NODE_8066_length_2722_cov_2.690431_5_plen_453_part_00